APTAGWQGHQQDASPGHGAIIARLGASGSMTQANAPAQTAGYFTPGDLPIPTPAAGEWNIAVADGPVIATAIHDGHGIRPSLGPLLSLSDAARFREEDPLTGILTTAGDVRIQ